ncbi:MAG: hypothetical protein CM15mP86_06780 [Gammaproteobacteria bacterium]|nr:MAG: hypothetical protein CM15mP86_06780 [Gammaproteobacteria bacterium]
MVNDDTSVDVSGDEPLIIYKNTQRPVCISSNRISAADKLIRETDTNIIISDDGLQHYKMSRDLEIVVFDGNRGIGKRTLLASRTIERIAGKIRRCRFCSEFIKDD